MGLLGQHLEYFLPVSGSIRTRLGFLFEILYGLFSGLHNIELVPRCFDYKAFDSVYCF